MKCVMLFALAGATGAALATPINYGNFAGTTVTYFQVTEDSPTDPTPLFGTPTILGDSLNFNPVSFGSTATNGSSDTTDGTLTTIIQASPGYGIPTIQFSETGDYTLAGAGGLGTSASVTLTITVQILEVNGAPIVPVQFSQSGTFSPSSGSYNLFNNGPTFGLQSWVGSATANVSGFLASQSIVGQATRVAVSVENGLTTTSEFGTLAFIKKKQIGGVAIAVIPTPGALALFGAGVMVAARRRR